VLERYFANLRGYVRTALDDKSRTPRQHLKRYLDIMTLETGAALCLDAQLLPYRGAMGVPYRELPWFCSARVYPSDAQAFIS
jgi:hypothetical protein